MGIEELVGGVPRPHQNQFNAVEAAEVDAVIGSSEVRLIVKSFSRDQAYATVPFIASTPANAPAVGTGAVLHSDSEGHPIYAVVFT